MTVFDILEIVQCDISTLSDVRDPLEEYCKTTIESRVAQLEMKFSCIDSLNGENAKLRGDNSKLHNDNAMQNIEIQDVMDHVAIIKGELEHANAKVASLEAEIEALKQCDDKNGLTRWKTIDNGLNSPSHEPEETPKDEGAMNDVTSANRHAKQANTRISGNLKHQRNLKVTQASSMMAA